MKIIRPIAAAAAAALTVLLGTTPLPTPAHAQPAQEQSSASAEEKDSAPAQKPGVEITSITPWLDDKGTLSISGNVRSGDAELKTPTLQVGMSTQILNSTDSVNSWADRANPHRTLTTIAPGFKPEDGDDAITAAPLPGTINANSTARFSVTIPAAKLGLSAKKPLSTWGARGIRVAVTTEAGPVGEPAAAFTTWYPNPKIDHTKLGVIIPATITRFGLDGKYIPQDLEKAAAGGELRDLLDAMKKAPDAAIALDPRLVVSISSTLETQQAPEETEAPDSDGESESKPGSYKELEAFWDEFREELTKHDIIPLPYADADLRSIRAVGEDKLAETAQAASRQITEAVPELEGHGRILRYSWPAAAGADSKHLDTFHATGHDALLLSEDQLPAETSYTSNARARITADDVGSNIPVLVTNRDLNEALGITQATRTGDDTPGEADGVDDPEAQPSERPHSPRTAEDISRTIALTAAITSERPFDQRSILMSLPRHTAEADWADLAAMPEDLPWLDPIRLPQLEKSEESDRGAFVTAQKTTLPAPTLAPLPGLYTDIGVFDSLFANPTEARTADSRMLLTCASVGWQNQPAGLNECVESASKAAEGFGGRIGIEQGSTVLLVTGESTTIPITVHNNSTREAELSVNLRPQTAQLQAETSPTQTIGPGEHARFTVPVKGIANADVPGRINLIAADGTTIPTDEEMLVRVRADWENIGTAIVGTGLAIVFVVGLYFSVRRGRPKIPQSQLEAAMARAESQND